MKIIFGCPSKYAYLLFTLMGIVFPRIVEAEVCNNLFNNGFSIYLENNRYFLLIPDSIISRDLLVVSRLTKSNSNENSVGQMGYGGYAGDKTCESLIRFERGPGKKLFLRSIQTKNKSVDSTINGMYYSVLNSNLNPIIYTFEISSSFTNVNYSVTDVTDFLAGDNSCLFFNSLSRSILQLGGYQRDKSFIISVNTFQDNILIRSVKTYSYSGDAFTTLELGTSIFVLKAKSMDVRIADSRVGYFTKEISDFDIDPQGITRVKVITKWNLEPKPEDVEKYRRGELVEPQKPILFYIDPATPKKWIPYLIKGVTDWQPAFEAAGFKNAILAREAPSKQEDPDWSIDDIRYSVIVYISSEAKDASYSTVIDPRSGEIIQSHIRWFHNAIQLLKDRYFVFASPVDAKAREVQFDDKLIGALITNTCSHEIGHALGFPHNYGASSTVPVENLRNKQWVEANGICPSIMDYARFNYVAQPADSINSIEGLFSRVGDYDKWAIEWGYRIHNNAWDQKSQKSEFDKWILRKTKESKYWYGGERDNIGDPRIQTEDLGNNLIESNTYGIKNLKIILANLVNWCRPLQQNYQQFRHRYNLVKQQFFLYIIHVRNYIGGIFQDQQVFDDNVPVYNPVPKEIQRKSILFLDEQLFKTPKWLFTSELVSLLGDEQTDISSQQIGTLSILMSSITLAKLERLRYLYNKNLYSVQELFDDLYNSIWLELTTYKVPDIYRRNLQKQYIKNLIKLINIEGRDPMQVDLPGMAKLELKKVQNALKGSMIHFKDRNAINHIKELIISSEALK